MSSHRITEFNTGAEQQLPFAVQPKSPVELEHPRPSANHEALRALFKLVEIAEPTVRHAAML